MKLHKKTILFIYYIAKITSKLLKIWQRKYRDLPIILKFHFHTMTRYYKDYIQNQAARWPWRFYAKFIFKATRTGTRLFIFGSDDYFRPWHFKYYMITTWVNVKMTAFLSVAFNEETKQKWPVEIIRVLTRIFKILRLPILLFLLD
jgi:hypothetical protein